MKIIVGITGASGVVYGIRLLEVLKGEKKIAWNIHPKDYNSKLSLHVVISKHGWKVIETETEYKRKDIERLARIYENEELSSQLSSGSFLFDSYVICPCSVSTLSKIACGISDNLITRLAAVALKERRKLVIVVRETPLSTLALENMARLSLHGAIILPAMPAFYHKPQNISDMVDFVVGKVLDSLGIENDMFERWSG